jgi:hypothetical protein
MMADAPTQPFLFGDNWIEVRDGNDSARAIFHRHYSRRPYKDGRKPKLIVGPGEKMVLLRAAVDALFIWRRFISDDGQTGVNCAVFRNEGPSRSSDLIREADALAEARWPGQRHFTYVNPRKVRSANPGYCFLMAGWRRCGVTKWNKLLILELPASAIPDPVPRGDS